MFLMSRGYILSRAETTFFMLGGLSEVKEGFANGLGTICGENQASVRIFRWMVLRFGRKHAIAI